MPISHKKKYGIYHWDTFDNETLLIGQKDSLPDAEKYVTKKYGDRIKPSGADVVEIVDKKGNVIRRYSIG